MNQTIQKFDKNTFSTLRPVIAEAIQNAVAKYGLTATLGNITFGETSFTAKIEVVTGNNDEAEYRKYARLYELDPEWYGKTFTNSKGETYAVIGLDTGRSKYSVKVQSPTGERRLVTAEAVRLYLGGDKSKVA